MKENIMDIAQDILSERLGEAKGVIKTMFKGSIPYRQERVPDEERIMNYYDFLDNPDVEQQLRLQDGDEVVDKYHYDMRELINKGIKKNA